MAAPQQPQQTITFDEALCRHVGQLGRGGLRIVALASLFQITNALGFFCLVFLAPTPAWQCASADDAACAAAWRESAAAPSGPAFCGLQQQQWRFTSQDSLVARFSLVCGDAWRTQMINMIMFVGAFIVSHKGSGLFGLLADSIGRRLPLFIATAIVAASTFASLAATSYWGYAATRAVTGLGCAGQAHCIFLLVTEITGPAYRGVASTGSLFFFTVGEFLLVLLGFTLPNWRHLTLAVGAINAAALLLFPLIPESARWLLAQGRTDEATALLARLAAANGARMPDRPLRATREDVGGDRDDACEGGSHHSGSRSQAGSSSSSTGGSAHQQQARVGLLELLREPRLLIRSLILMIVWFALLSVYYGVSMGSGGLPGSLYVTFSLATAAEVAALAVAGPAVDRVGRHNVVLLGLLLGGGACLGCALWQQQAAQVVLAAIGKLGCSGAESVIAIFTAELFPTPVRSTAMGLFSQSSRLGSIAAPFLLMAGAQLGGRSPVFIPYLAFGSMSLLAGLLVLVLPETLGAAMPETMQDMAALQSLFAAKPWRQGCWATLAFLFRRRASTAQALPAVQRHAAPAALPAAGTGKDAASRPPHTSEEEQEVVVTVHLPSPARDKRAASGDGEDTAGLDRTGDS